jgi:hypothetical protein
LARKAFESFTNTYTVKDKHYHADIGHFAAIAFLELLETNWTITVCGANTQCQVGVKEKGIRDLT